MPPEKPPYLPIHLPRVRHVREMACADARGFVECGSLLPLCPREACLARPLRIETRIMLPANDPPERWAHSPPHVYTPNCTYIITAGTYQRAHFFNGPAKLTLLQDMFMDEAERRGWLMRAWAFFPNHYHVIAVSPGDKDALKTLMRAAHSKLAIEVNRLDGVMGRRVWFEYWDTCLTYQRSYFARLNYVIRNPVKHGLVSDSVQYAWCSAAWFHRNATTSFRDTILGMESDSINIKDDF